MVDRRVASIIHIVDGSARLSHLLQYIDVPCFGRQRDQIIAPKVPHINIRCSFCLQNKSNPFQIALVREDHQLISFTQGVLLLGQAITQSLRRRLQFVALRVGVVGVVRVIKR